MTGAELRQMKNELSLGSYQFRFYSSTFDPKTGTLVRETIEPEDPYETLMSCVPPKIRIAVQGAYESKFERTASSRMTRRRAWSPVPEHVELKITDRCDRGCSYCYMGSTPNGQDMPVSMLGRVFDLDQPPYGVALGGGEPMLHPDFPEILSAIRGYGSVPSFTTAMKPNRRDVLHVVNDVVGGIAVSFHEGMTQREFFDLWSAWYEATDEHVQLNVHVIMDRDVEESLKTIERVMAQNKVLGKLRLVLLAYHPDVGRSDLTRLPRASSYNVTLPARLERLAGEGVRIAFSEGLLPYFLSREIGGVVMDMAAPAEGHFSCAIDTQGKVTFSSFDNDPRSEDVNVVRFQEIWNAPRWWWLEGQGGPACSGCGLEMRCSKKVNHHVALCGWAPHNTTTKKQPLSRQGRLQAGFAAILGM